MSAQGMLQTDRDPRGDTDMSSWTIAFAAALGLAAGLIGADANAQSADTPDTHVAAAKAAAGQIHTELFSSLCSTANISPSPAPERGQRAGGAGAPAGPP